MKNHYYLMGVLLLFSGYLLMMGCAPKLTDQEHEIAARDIVKSLKVIYSPDHIYRPVSVTDNPLLDHTYYDATTTDLENLDYVYLGELEDQTLTAENPHLKTAIRVMAGEDGTVLAAHYHIRKSRQLPKGLKIIEFETEFSDGIIFNTNNNPQAKVMTSPEEIVVQTEVDLPITELHSLHLKRIQEVEQANPIIVRTRFESLADAIEYQHRLDRIRHRYRESIQGVTLKELKFSAGQEFKNRIDFQKLLSLVQDAYSNSAP